VSADTLTRARSGDEVAFRELVDPYRRELRAHCYRILGSALDAEDVLQETLLAAWRGIGEFEGRSSLRAWLYRIATNRCLNALRDGARRTTLPTPVRELPEPTRRTEPVWLEPYPDELVEGIADLSPGPEARYDSKESLTLAFVIALQQLPPRQRAVLILRDVLGFHAAEVAAMLDATVSSVTSALKRARATLDHQRSAGHPDHTPLPQSTRERDIVQGFADAFENDDIDAVVALLTDDAKLTMPPEPVEYQGRDAIAAFLRDRCSKRVGRGFRLVHTGANTQPAFGCYLKDNQSPIACAHGLIVLTLEDDRISAITRFLDSSVYRHFGLPRTLPGRVVTTLIRRAKRSPMIGSLTTASAEGS
jgi:RNA polymerase sigma-70 factor (TIGR02960 family)